MYCDFSTNWFINQEYSWLICNSSDNEKKLNTGKWDGPFYILDPSGHRVRVYGRVGEYEDSQKNFINNYQTLLDLYNNKKKTKNTNWRPSKRAIQKALFPDPSQRIASNFVKSNHVDEEE